jgi:hypothetical protein
MSCPAAEERTRRIFLMKMYILIKVIYTFDLRGVPPAPTPEVEAHKAY